MTSGTATELSQATNPKDWVYIGPERAKQHKLYGPKNWLAVFAFGLIFGPLREWGEAMSVAREYGLTLGELLTESPTFDTFFTLVMATHLVINGTLLWMMFTKHPKFRIFGSAGLLASYPLWCLWALVSGFSEAGKSLALALFPWLVGCAVWVTYLNVSRRVRVTYEHKVRAGELGEEELSELSAKVTAPGPMSASAHVPMPSPAAAPVRQAAPAPQPARAAPASEEDLWARALAEFEGPERRQGLWAKAFSEMGGNEAAAKAKYLSERVAQLRVSQ